MDARHCYTSIPLSLSDSIVLDVLVAKIIRDSFNLHLHNFLNRDPLTSRFNHLIINQSNTQVHSKIAKYLNIDFEIIGFGGSKKLKRQWCDIKFGTKIKSKGKLIENFNGSYILHFPGGNCSYYLKPGYRRFSCKDGNYNAVMKRREINHPKESN
ncbi:hypothetical protein CAAN1_05S00188 [[Candida] anglica]|uniref:Homing endonuclease LAGLIDADG domain-containing protein n=1 Tax=[Candida] anglica TaxID=148631 RepID=A0ABP0ED06_9ASCO